MGIFEYTMSILSYVNMLAWLVAAGASLKFRTFFKSNREAWTYIMIGSMFVLGRQIIKLIPAYGVSDIVYIIRYVVGGIGSLILFIGFLKLYMASKK